MGYDDSYSGILFRNETKKSEKSPDFSGDLNIDGKPHRIVGWFRVGKSGKKFISLKAEPKDESESRRGATPARQQSHPAWVPTENLDDVPF